MGPTSPGQAHASLFAPSMRDNSFCLKSTNTSSARLAQGVAWEAPRNGHQVLGAPTWGSSVPRPGLSCLSGPQVRGTLAQGLTCPGTEHMALAVPERPS